MTDFRALCAELVDALDSGIPAGRIRMSPLAERARAALAQPAPEGPTKAELHELLMQIGGHLRIWEFNWLEPFARAVLDRWGRPTPQPADGEVAELVVWLRLTADEQPHTSGQGGIRLTRAADLLERLILPQPIPVSERLPGPGDCDAEGRCWIYMPDIGTDPSWRLVDPRDIGPYHTHWLPAHALPTPRSEND